MGLWQDLQFAVRLLIKDKWFTLVAAIALALGIGVNATVFTFVNAVLIRGLPFNEPDRIMALSSRDAVRDRNMGVSYLDFKDWSAATQTFTGPRRPHGQHDERERRGTRARAIQRGVRHGQRLSKSSARCRSSAAISSPEDDRPGAAAVVMLGNGIWKSRYGADAGIVGRTIRVNDIPSVVIGVMGDGFKFPQNADLWQPLALVPNIENQQRNARGFEAFGRLGPDDVAGARAGRVRDHRSATGQRLSGYQQGCAASRADLQ